ncbi:MAG: NUDIX domain-containing protein [Nanoarchaeota archaeon]
MRSLFDLFRHLPRFSDGRINFSNSPEAPVTTIFLCCEGKVLLLKRSEQVGSYKGKWNAVAGYLDEEVPLRQKVLAEVEEEVGIASGSIGKISFGRPYRLKDKEVGRVWLVHPVLAVLKEQPKVILDWEHTDFRWLEPEALFSLDHVPNLEKSWDRIKDFLP